jgi:predicted metalloprotease
VSLLPVIVPFQHKILSSSGNADIPESPLICQHKKTDYWMNHFYSKW